QRTGPVPQPAVEEPAREVADPLWLVDRARQRRRARADREVGVAELRRDRARGETVAPQVGRDVLRHAPELGVERRAITQVPLERLLGRDRDPLCVEVEVARVDAARAVAEEPAYLAGE